MKSGFISPDSFILLLSILFLAAVVALGLFAGLTTSAGAATQTLAEALAGTCA